VSKMSKKKKKFGDGFYILIFDILIFAISGFRREVAENCLLLGHYTPRSDNFLSTFRDNISVPSLGFRLSLGFLNPEDGTVSLS